jgi:hypothetical protein
MSDYPDQLLRSLVLYGLGVKVVQAPQPKQGGNWQGRLNERGTFMLARRQLFVSGSRIGQAADTTSAASFILRYDPRGLEYQESYKSLLRSPS